VSELDTAVGERLKILRLARGQTQQELAHTVGVAAQQLQKYEVGQNRISAGRLAALAAVLQVPVSAFYDGSIEEALGREPPVDRRFSDLKDAWPKLSDRDKVIVSELARRLAAGTARGG
jgi:transcriptional regulator with XRE-family HTH domain